ncbi:MAG: tRNA (N6-threonylcarbamoyladenosine(37)-N6)-methyltransferase TrmO [Rhodospirillaceae bacterium]|nr:tRNA (N6-threonylcarbamoyladenosine(37)-N6)-methyltransferase TrmO [Rhodospirillaceae bacterium]
MDAATVNFIGKIRTPYKTTTDCPGQARPENGTARIELNEEMLPALKGIETKRHLQILYWLDKADRSILQCVPRWAENGEEYGVFSLRSPVRPNPIALSTVKLLSVEGTVLIVSALDCLDETPVLDIKPYIDQLK